jgi:hypothetical protein
MFNPNQAFLLVQKLKLDPRAFTLGVKAELEKMANLACFHLAYSLNSTWKNSHDN